MAQKEIAIKVKVEGQEISMTGKQLDAFKKTVESLKKQLELLGQRTEENGEQFDKLKGDLDALNTAFGETNEEVKDTTDSLEDNESQTENNTKATKSYAAQIRTLRVELANLGDRTDENAVQYDALTEKIRDLSEKQEDLQFGTKKLDDAFASLPGPLGRVGQGFKSLTDAKKNATTVMRGLTAQFPILRNAIAATGIGALVVVIGLLVGAVIKAFQTFKPLQEAVGKLNIVFELIGKTIQPVIDLIGKGLTKVVEGFGYAVAFVTGNLKEYNKEVKNLNISSETIKKLQDDIDELKKRQLLATGAIRDELKAEIEYKEKLIELERKYIESNGTLITRMLEDLKNFVGLSTAYTEEELKVFTNYINELNDIENDYKKKKKENSAVFEEEELKLQNEHKQLLIKNEKDKELEILRLQKEAQKKSIEQLELKDNEEKKLLEKLDKIYLLKRKEIIDKYAKQEKEAIKDLNKQIRNIRTSLIEDERERFAKEQENKMADEIEAINAIVVLTEEGEKLKYETIKAIREKYQKELEQYDIEYTNKLGEENKKRNENEKKSAEESATTLWNQYQFERETRQLILDARLKDIESSYLDEIDLAKKKSEILKLQAEEDRKSELDSIKKLEDEKQITHQQYLDREIAIKQNYSATIKEIEFNTYEEITVALGNYRASIEAVNSTIGTMIGMMDKESKAAKILAKTQQVLTAVTMSLAAAEAFRGLMKDIGKGFPANVIAVASTLATIAAAVISWTQIFKKSAPSDVSSTGGSSGGNNTPNYGKNYADGGMIGGKRHAQGGTLIEAEQGEAIMTRGAVSMFKPMLSMMNQMGGGKSFDARLTHYDNPITKEKTEIPIIKTYVVANEMSKEQEKYARLKDLSTL